MASNLPARAYAHGTVDVTRDRQVRQALNAINARTEIALAETDAAAELVGRTIQARNGLAVLAGQADAMLSGMLSALPVNTPTDVPFRLQLLQAARAGAIADVLGFQP